MALHEVEGDGFAWRGGFGGPDCCRERCRDALTNERESKDKGSIASKDERRKGKTFFTKGKCEISFFKLG